MDEGYLKLHRQIRLWEWHTDPYTVSLFIHLLCWANYLPNYKFRGKRQRVGELHTSFPMLAELTGMHVNTVTDRLKKLQKTGEIKVKTTNKGIDIYIVKYAEYQNISDSSTTSDVVQDVVQDVACHVAQDVVQDVVQGKKAQKNAQKQACTTRSTTSDVARHVSNQEYNILESNNTKEKNKKEKSEAASTAELEAQFDIFRKAYKGTKRGLKVELDNFKKKNDNWREIVPLLMPALAREIAWREQAQAAGQFVPQWAYLQTWLNQHRWESEFESVDTHSGDNAKAQSDTTGQPPTDEDYGGSFGGMEY